MIEGKKAVNPFSPDAQSEAATARISAPDAIEAVAPQLSLLQEQGFVLIPSAIDADMASDLAREIAVFNGQTPWGRSDFDGFRTRRVYNLLAKTRALDSLCLDRRVVALVEAYLDDEIQLSQTLGITVYPGETEQALHRDDGYYRLQRPRPPLIVNAFWALTDFTSDNGATRMIPGTHRTSDAEPPDCDPILAEMTAGSVVVYDGSLFHGGGANRSALPRTGLTILYARAWLRQQENQYLSIPRETILELSRPMQRLLGYWVAGNLLGWVEGRSPLHTLKPG